MRGPHVSRVYATPVVTNAITVKIILPAFVEIGEKRRGKEEREKRKGKRGCVQHNAAVSFSWDRETVWVSSIWTRSIFKDRVGDEERYRG